MFNQEEKMLIEDYALAEKHNHNLSTQYYIIKLYQEMKRYETTLSLPVVFKIPVRKNYAHNPDLPSIIDNSEYILESKKIHPLYIDKNGLEVSHEDEYNLREFLREDIFCYALNSDKEKEYFYNNRMLSLDNFSDMVNYIKNLHSMPKDFDYTLKENQDVEKISYCGIEMPVYTKNNFVETIKEIDEREIKLRHIISDLNKKATLYIAEKIANEDVEFSFEFFKTKKGDHREIKAINEINLKTGVITEHLNTPSADYMFWHLSQYQQKFVKNEKGNISKISLESIMKSVVENNERFGPLIKDPVAFNIELENIILSANVSKLANKTSMSNKARI